MVPTFGCTRMGHRLLILHDYVFYRERGSKTGSIWSCHGQKRKCRARAKIDIINGIEFAKLTYPVHTHPPEEYNANPKAPKNSPKSSARQRKN